MKFRWWLRGKPCFCGGDKDGHGRYFKFHPEWCVLTRKGSQAE